MKTVRGLLASSVKHRIAHPDNRTRHHLYPIRLPQRFRKKSQAWTQAQS
jgi:hypothetical protein